MCGEQPSNANMGEWVFFISDALANFLPPNPEPLEFKDPGSFFIPVMLGDGKIRIDASLDLGSGINLMSKSLFDSIGRLELSPFEGTITLVNNSSITPLRVVKNLLVGIGSLLFSGDFIILDIDEEKSETSILLGRPFLHEARTTIDVHEGKVTFRLKEKTETIIASPRVTCYRVTD